MKTHAQLIAALGLFSAAAFTSFAETAYTNPVMASSTEIAGNTSGEGMRLTTLGITALNPIEATGVLDSVAGYDAESDYTTFVVTDVPSDWESHDFDNPGGVVEFNWRDVPLYFVTVTSGDYEGQIMDVIATGADTDNTLTVAGNFSDLDLTSSTITFEIRKAHTIAEIFGENNEAGLKSGASVNDATLVYNIYQGEFETIYYQATSDRFGGTGWRIAGPGIPSVDVSSTRIDPDFGLIIGNKNTDGIHIVSTGDVYVGEATSSINPGYNALINKYPVDCTLDQSNLYTNDGGSGIASGVSSNDADLVYLLDVSSIIPEWKIYYYQDAPERFGGVGWRVMASGAYASDVGDTVVAANTVLLVMRRGTTSSYWNQTQPFEL